jgi:hypothetical protein
MRVNWVFTDDMILDPLADTSVMKDIGSFWGSWKTWRSCSTDNVVCHNLRKATELVQRDFATKCNLYIPNEIYISLNRPQGVYLYEGKFVDDIQPEEIVAMHLAASVSDIVLLLGFDWTEQPKKTDKLLEHRAHVYRTLIKHVIGNNRETQWVLVDHAGEIMPFLSALPNLTQDSMQNVFELFST